jgi:hypothetical protein
MKLLIQPGYLLITGKAWQIRAFLRSFQSSKQTLSAFLQLYHSGGKRQNGR